ncbi:MAG: hypothetical protein A2750_01865 [Candidatus Yanofskybacteria bacterium RIFCSPHIGHO2_01_FULL_45_42]|uniref:RNase H type-1 domain-containing protein n=3 Tax=Candidatus Yanofskyibacteriota TaxID=1752733 RepID=A0A1F8H3P8_9BACT|nr:MAG: hypothetical protein A2750_01865 [Candidatus Yanofskybacteria bacterium RIFCSPHIGHO2_01_FULL_45_42]OGN15561.1 MAG: hypothetical protein A3C81_00250 [Candidatus Yanofskybacteria bacterium RIFCSPHIGHO2_02_FULL_46_19]OGN27259.1 MAG: hypothetical protein A3B17_00660 [Candidatus Yanofskybacteria bacterium RIFCSPLOWO2_01_FULL_45_72]OGN32197.1 MAG: hypothetical protein A3J01_01240 [Candidatus Yanofskybacteria bacterium RIFCSPLOWO2_02_FULL_45_18]
MAKHKYLIHTDGGARGNPGPSALGVVIEGDIERKEYGEYLGEQTNNFAEYSAVIFALKKLKSLIGGEKSKNSVIEIHADSELLVKQLNGEYKIKEEGIQKLFLEVWNLKLDFGEVAFRHIPREENHGADALVNGALDREASKLF